jgi:Tol biopolymer transport system component
VLAKHLSASSEVRARFEREARAVSALNHPNICVLHDIGRDGDTDYLVLELVTGETLASRLARGPLPLGEALQVGEQIAAALDRAHRAGVVHRDLKPGNIMLTKAGAKLMDFGLARALRGPDPEARDGLTVSPTEAQPITAEGAIVGTYPYMSPEQLEGQDVDARSDLWSLGCVLYEMVTGKRAFSGASQASLVSAILRDEPAPASQVVPLSPVGLDRLIQACLAKSRDDRLQTAHDVKLQLRWIAEGGSSAGAPAIARGVRTRREWQAWGVAALALLAAAVLALTRHDEAPVIRASIPPPANAMFLFFGDNAGPPVLSRDGSRLAFVAVDEERGARVWVRDVASLATRVLPGTENATYPFWSPDGRSIGFFADFKLKRVDVASGQVFMICETGAGRGGTWNERGEIAYASDFQSDISVVPAMGGTPRVVTRRDSTQTTHRWPQFLPDGRHFLYMAANHNEATSPENSIWIGSTDGRERRKLMPSVSDAQYADGYLFYARDSVLLARPFDPRALRFRGDAIPTADRVQFDATTWKANFSLAHSGLLAYQPVGGKQGSQIRLMDRTGRAIRLVGESGNHFSVHLMRDGRSIVYSSQVSPNSDLYRFDLETEVSRRLTTSIRDEDQPMASHDGRWLAFTSGSKPMGQESPRYGIMLMPAAGGATPRMLLDAPGSAWPLDWTKDDRLLLIAKGDIGTAIIGDSMGLLSPHDPVRVHWLPAPAGQFDFASISHDGRWVAYGTLGTDPQVFLDPLPDPANPAASEGRQRIQVSTHGGNQPHWRADDREIYYARPDGMVVAVALEPGTMRPGREVELFRANIRFPYQALDVSPDGQRFLVNVLASSGAAPIALVSGWKQALRAH